MSRRALRRRAHGPDVRRFAGFAAALGGTVRATVAYMWTSIGRRARLGLRGVVLFALAVTACADASSVSETGSTSEDVQAHGDRRDPALAKSDRVGAEAEVWGRRVALHISDADNMVWASIDDGDPGDPVWLDRSWDGGENWDGKIGSTTIPKGGRSWRTMMFNVDDPNARRVGAARACAKASNRPDIACTPWLRSKVGTGTRADAAATAMMQMYDAKKGQWRVGWWNSANALTALADHVDATGDGAYRYAIATTYDRNKSNHFTNDYMDDTGWWGLAWVRAYDVTHDARYLEMAKRDADYLWSFHDGTCGGGVWWRDKKDYKNAITNELFVKLAASLHNRITGDTVYLDRGLRVWNWFEASGMINAQNLVNDGLDEKTCKNNGQVAWTYNQGVLLGGLVELHRATGDAKYLDRARVLADASTNDLGLNPDGILREPCESSADKCGADGPSFKGAFARNLGELDRALPNRPYRNYLKRQADAMFGRRTSLDQYGVHWAGPFDKFDASRQHSALDLLTAADW